MYITQSDLVVPHGFHHLRVHRAQERVAVSVVSALLELILIDGALFNFTQFF